LSWILGSGGGFDVFIAGRKVGATGRAIGVDMTPEMLAKARKNIAAYRERSGLDNAEFRLGEIEHLPLADDSVDVVISNCVINLSPDKPQVWREICAGAEAGRTGGGVGPGAAQAIAGPKSERWSKRWWDAWRAPRWPEQPSGWRVKPD